METLPDTKSSPTMETLPDTKSSPTMETLPDTKSSPTTSTVRKRRPGPPSTVEEYDAAIAAMQAGRRKALLKAQQNARKAHSRRVAILGGELIRRAVFPSSPGT